MKEKEVMKMKTRQILHENKKKKEKRNEFFAHNHL